MTSTQEPLEPVHYVNDMQRSMSPGQDHPGVKVTFTLSEVFYNPAFVVKCSAACVFAGQEVAGVSSVQALSSPQDPTIAGVAYSTPSQMLAGTVVTLSFRSRDNTPIDVVLAQPYIPPTR
jgi:hypothetical protein